ncbi:MAG: Ig-like domain-containing protein [Gemmatimonadaceae bacterium]|nr:Ig-like domain-containing protein [Gemmatimonadaceae bacterium]
MRVVPVVCLVAVAACAESAVETIPVASIDVTPDTATVRAGGSLSMSARVLDSTGATIDVGGVVWSSSNASVASVSSAGVVTALLPGTARIAVSAGGKSATADITVAARDVASVVVNPPTLSIRVGVSTPLQALTLDAEGGTLTGRAVTWNSSAPAIATVSASGVVTGVAAGAATITATSAGRVGQAAVTVTLPPVQTVTVSRALDTIGVTGSVTKTAVLRDASNTVLTGRALSWSSSNVAVATVSSTGNVLGLAPGTVTISATSEGRIGNSTVVVLARLASAVILTPATTTLIVGVTQQLSAQITDAQGNLLTGRPIAYASDAPTVASVSASGLVTALAPGTARITATSEGKTGVSTVQVIPVPVASVQVTPATATLLTGRTQQLTATPRSAAGTVLTGRVITWATGAPGIATVSATGLVSAIAPGIALVLATIDGVTQSATITVTAPAIASVTITPSAPVIDPFGSVQLTATPRDAAGTALTGRVVTWSSADELTAFVSSTGLVVGFKSGTVLITATSEGVSASTLVRVR